MSVPKIFRSIYKRLNNLFSHPFQVYKREGAYFLLNRNTLMDEGIIKFKKYENHLIDRAKEIIEKNNIKYFFDIGSNIGFYSVLLGKLSTIEKIYSFEPLPMLFQQINSNILINNLTPKWTGFNCALSDKNDKAEFFYNPYFLGTSSLKQEWANNRGTHSIKVDVNKFDDLIDIRQENCFVKIDVEGNELETVRGMKEFLLANKVYMQIESSEENIEEIKNLLSGAGYRLVCNVSGNDYYISNMNIN